MSDAPARWSDLAPRIASAIVLTAIGLGAIWQGGLVFGALVALAVGLIIWEVARMLAPARVQFGAVMGLLGGAAVLAGGFVNTPLALLLLLATALGGAAAMGAGAERARFVIYTLWILLAGFGLSAMRLDGGLAVVLWLVLVVVATDTAGYFAGRSLGGPKFWPRISPKKTWSGTIAGWLAAALVGLVFGGLVFGGQALWLALVSAGLSFASQMGDAAESALKRHTCIKDSSNLIPGHGGVFDRFDALMGAALVLTLAMLAGQSLPVAG